LLLYHRQAMRPALVTNHILDHLAQGLIGPASFADLAIPFYAVACDLVANQRVVIGSGSVAAAVAASGAIPGVFEPILDDGRLLVDGCVLDVLPCEVARLLGAEFLVAVDIGQPPEPGAPRHAAGIQQRVSDLRADCLRHRNRALADVLIEPNVAGIEWMEVSRSEDAYRAGHAAAHAKLSELRHAASKARWRTLPRRLLGKTQPPGIALADITPRPAEPTEETAYPG
jgi:NTE family protein